MKPTDKRERILSLNVAGQAMDVSVQEADELGAFKEDALSEQEALEGADEG